MRPGPVEIVIIIAVIIAIAMATRILRSNRPAETQNEKYPAEVQVRQEEPGAGKAQRRLNRSGIAFILAGVVLLVVGIGILKWAFQTYMWAIIIVIIGFLILFLSRKK